MLLIFHFLFNRVNVFLKIYGNFFCLVLSSIKFNFYQELYSTPLPRFKPRWFYDFHMFVYLCQIYDCRNLNLSVLFHIFVFPYTATIFFGTSSFASRTRGMGMQFFYNVLKRDVVNPVITEIVNVTEFMFRIEFSP